MDVNSMYVITLCVFMASLDHEDGGIITPGTRKISQARQEIDVICA